VFGHRGLLLALFLFLPLLVSCSDGGGGAGGDDGQGDDGGLSLSLSAESDWLYSDGKQAVEIEAALSDESGEPVDAAILVETSAGEIMPSPMERTGAGEYRASLSVYSEEFGVANVRAWVEGRPDVSSALEISYAPFYPDDLVVESGGDEELSFDVSESGELTLGLELYSVGCGWDRDGAESVVLNVCREGALCQQPVVFWGHDWGPHNLDILFGSVEAGRETFSFSIHPASRCAGSIVLRGYAVDVVPPESENWDVYRYAPFFYQRPDADVTDTILLFYAEQSASRIRYETIFSNEDGGTGVLPPLLMSDYGRTTDIEWTYRIEFDGQGQVTGEYYQGKGHQTKPFGGQRFEDHPYLSVCTKNGMFCDDGDSWLLVAPAPLISEDASPRESLMDGFPLFFWAVNEEMIREKKAESVPDPSTLNLSDERGYVYVRFWGDNLTGNEDLRIGVEYDGNWFYSDHGVGGMFLRSWSGQTAVEVGYGYDPSRLEAVGAFCTSATCRWTLERFEVYVLTDSYNFEKMLEQEGQFEVEGEDGQVIIGIGGGK